MRPRFCPFATRTSYAYFDRSYSLDHSSQAKVSLLDGIRPVAPLDASFRTPSLSTFDSIVPTEGNFDHSAPLVATNSPFPTVDPSTHTPGFLSIGSRSLDQDRTRTEEQRAIAESIRNAVDHATETSLGRSR